MSRIAAKAAGSSSTRGSRYPACCVKPASAEAREAHEARVAERESKTARSASDDLAALEALLASGAKGPEKLAEARALKAKVDEAVDEGRLPPLDPKRQQGLVRGLRLLAFS